MNKCERKRSERNKLICMRKEGETSEEKKEKEYIRRTVILGEVFLSAFDNIFETIWREEFQSINRRGLRSKDGD